MYKLSIEMNLAFDLSLAKGYTSQSQIARVLTEDWMSRNSYCPNCGTDQLNQFKNNLPVADFYCGVCAHQFELKSKLGPSMGKKIVDGAYESMIKRIQAIDNPNFFFLTYLRSTWSVDNLMIIPKHRGFNL